jgi:uncharacterized membrane protein
LIIVVRVLATIKTPGYCAFINPNMMIRFDVNYKEFIEVNFELLWIGAMTYILFARWFGLVSVILSLGILFNLEDARDMAKHMVKSDSGYIMGGVLPIIFGSLSLMFVNSFQLGWTLIITLIGGSMLLIGIFRVIFVKQWKALLSQYLQEIPFLFSLFGLMFGVILLYVGFIADYFVF